MSNDFFQEPSEQSMIKARIVSKYFSVWAKIILSTQMKHTRYPQRMAYVDLFAGPGRYDDQSKSTPVLVLETILSSPELSNRVITIFNDKDMENIESLGNAIKQIPGIEKLTFVPTLLNEEVGEDIVNIFRDKHLVPTFFFVDPWGYKGLSLNLVSSIIKDWGCDCVFFFNYNRVNMGINNDAVRSHMVSLFGEERLDNLRCKLLKGQSPEERERIVVQELRHALTQSGSKYVLPFCFKRENGERTSHHLFFLSKSFLAYDRMKEIMATESSDTTDGVASFEHNPRDMYYKQLTLFDEASSPLDDLENSLVKQYAGQTISFEVLYEKHSVNTPYIKRNYRDVLHKMLEKGLISAVNPKTNKPPYKRTFPSKTRITFRGVT